MNTIYDIEINNLTILSILERQLSICFKLLPMREEDLDWEKPLETLILELLGMQGLFPKEETLILLVYKLQGLKDNGKDIDFMMYRRTIFECCSLIDKLKKDIQ